MKKFLLVLLALFTLSTSTPVQAANPSTVVSVASIAALQALGAASSQYSKAQVTGYRAGTTVGGGTFTWSSTSTLTADTCVVFQATGVTTGRWIRQFTSPSASGQFSASGPSSQIEIDPTMCGARWDDNGDDTSAINTAILTAQTYNYGVFFPAGVTSIRSTIALKPGVNIRGAGQYQTVVDCGGLTITSTPCMWLNLPADGQTSNGPRITDMAIRNDGTYAVEINTPSATFCNGTPGCVNVSLRPHLDRLYVVGGSVAGIGCFACFDGTISGNYITDGGLGASIPLTEGVFMVGSDLMTIGGDQGTNRIIDSINWAIDVESAGGAAQFGNLCKISHNELLNTAGGNGIIYDSCVSSIVENNFLETNNAQSGIITVDTGAAGALNAIIQGNWISSVPSPCWLKVTTVLAQIGIYDNQTTNPTVSGSSCFPNYKFWYNSVTRAVISHHGNFTEVGIPFNTEASATRNVGLTYFDATADSYFNISAADNGTDVKVLSLATDPDFGWFLIPQNQQIDFTNTPFPITGTRSICFIAQGGGAGVVATVQPYDNGAPLGGAVAQAVSNTNVFCPAGLAGLAPGTSLTMTIKNTGAGPALYLREIYVK